MRRLILPALLACLTAGTASAQVVIQGGASPPGYLTITPFSSGGVLYQNGGINVFQSYPTYPPFTHPAYSPYYNRPYYGDGYGPYPGTYRGEYSDGWRR